ncbi:MAG: hypothetical protein UT50_C0029G0005 [Candidatus Moranbacteria bacterium GW2011_GWA2_39_41]|nr:MAG: hypothetical protein UT50_C0029G0005 [Candidatus Moranbacteria bacterium GW2011_GWA2_39_41]
MTNINLSTNNTAEAGQEERRAKNGLVAVIIIFLIIVGSYVGLLFWNNDLNKKIVIANAEYDAIHSQPISGMNIEVADLQSRIFLAKKLVKKENMTLNVLEDIEKNIVSGVYLESYKSDVNTGGLKLECNADNYDSMARQVLNLKSLKRFSEVTVGDAKINEKGGIKFSISVSLTN